jgi:hypothetical protein
MGPAEKYTAYVRDLDGFLNLEPLVSSIQHIFNDYLPASYLIAFVLLVVGVMRGFLFTETRQFMQNLLRAVLLVATISFLPNFIDWCDQAFKAFAELPAAETVTFGNSSYTIKPSNGSAVTGIEQVLKSKIAVSNAATAKSARNDSSTQGSPQLSGNPFDMGKNMGTMWNYVVGKGVNLVWQILFAIYLLCLLLCKVIIILMQFLQKLIVMGFKLYAPIGVAEYAHHSLKSKATGFFLTFIGILSWPVGWSIVNAVTLGVFRTIPAPQDQNFATLIIAIVLAVPVLLWVVIGHVVAPIYMQKIVLRSGGVIQGFAGTMLSTVGAGSMATFAATAGSLANGMRNVQRVREEVRNNNVSRDSSRKMGSHQLVLAQENLLSAEDFGNIQKQPAIAGDRLRGKEAAIGGLSNLGTGVLDAGTGLMNRLGSVARFIGHAVAEGGGDGAGLDYRALAAFAPQNSNSRSSINRINRSSLQARKYLSEE